MLDVHDSLPREEQIVTKPTKQQTAAQAARVRRAVSSCSLTPMARKLRRRRRRFQNFSTEFQVTGSEHQVQVVEGLVMGGICSRSQDNVNFRNKVLGEGPNGIINYGPLPSEKAFISVACRRSLLLIFFFIIILFFHQIVSMHYVRRFKKWILTVQVK